MSATAQKIPLAEALAQAEAFRQQFLQLDPYCAVRWEFAGSLRRRKPACGDVEHVVIPAFRAEDTLFGARPAENLLRAAAAALLRRGVFTLHRYGEKGSTRFGDTNMGLEFSGHVHEIFCATPSNWGWKLMAFTGPREFNLDLLRRLKSRALTIASGQLCRKAYDTGAAGATRIVLQQVDCPDEETLFTAAGLPFIPPEKRG